MIHVNLLLTLCLSLVLLGCVSLSPQTRRLLDQPISPEKYMIKGLENLSKDNGDCGPGALAMALNWSGKNVAIEDIKPKVLTPKKNGSLPSDMISTARHYGRLAVELNSLRGLVAELGAGTPVIALLNMGFDWLPVWHYVLVVGYDVNDQEFKMFSGGEALETMPFTYFERHWTLAKNWGLVLLPPNKLANSIGELEHMRAASSLESIGKLLAAKTAYQTILKKWPQSFTAHVGMANIAFKEKDFAKAVS